MASRDLRIRRSNINKKDIQFPFLFLRSELGYSVESILRTPGVNIDTFPRNIKEYFWISSGLPGQKHWIALGQLENGTYFLYTAYMIMLSKTFVNNGHMNLWISVRFSDLIQFAMDSSIYSLYINSTEV